jgi:hypothetical protein
MIIAAVAGLGIRSRPHLHEEQVPDQPAGDRPGRRVPPESTIAMFAGAAFFAIAHKIWGPKKESLGHRLWVDTHEPICAGIIAGAAIIGIGDVLVKVFLL